jgi:hypothetical protein
MLSAEALSPQGRRYREFIAHRKESIFLRTLTLKGFELENSSIFIPQPMNRFELTFQLYTDSMLMNRFELTFRPYNDSILRIRNDAALRSLFITDDPSIRRDLIERRDSTLAKTFENPDELIANNPEKILFLRDKTQKNTRINNCIYLIAAIPAIITWTLSIANILFHISSNYISQQAAGESRAELDFAAGNNTYMGQLWQKGIPEDTKGRMSWQSLFCFPTALIILSTLKTLANGLSRKFHPYYSDKSCLTYYTLYNIISNLIIAALPSIFLTGISRDLTPSDTALAGYQASYLRTFTGACAKNSTLPLICTLPSGQTLLPSSLNPTATYNIGLLADDMGASSELTHSALIATFTSFIALILAMKQKLTPPEEAHLEIGSRYTSNPYTEIRNAFLGYDDLHEESPYHLRTTYFFTRREREWHNAEEDALQIGAYAIFVTFPTNRSLSASAENIDLPFFTAATAELQRTTSYLRRRPALRAWLEERVRREADYYPLEIRAANSTGDSSTSLLAPGRR